MKTKIKITAIAAMIFLIVTVAAFTQDANAKPEIQNGIQIVNSTLLRNRYPAITVQQGIPVRWIINAPPGSINGCNNRFGIREYGIQHTFMEGDNIIEFLPEKPANFRTPVG